VISVAALLGVFACSLFVSYAAVGAFRRLAFSWGIVAIPNERSSHSRAVPLGGGVVLVVVNLAGWIWYAETHGQFSRVLVYMVASALLIGAISLLDDLRHVPVGIRILVHLTAATVVVFGIGHWSQVEFPVVGLISIGALGVPLTVIWIVGLINSYNFMDGLDGMAAGQASTAGIGWLVLGWATGHHSLAVMGALLAATSLGFLIHNWQPASIFMGDVGSTFLGYSLAILPVIAAMYDPRFVLVGVLLVWPAIFDSGFTVLRRLSRHENVLTGHRSFLFHRLVYCGWSHAGAASLYTALPLLGAGLAFSWEYNNRLTHLGAAVGLCLLCLGLWLLVRHQERQLLGGMEAPISQVLLEGADRTTADSSVVRSEQYIHEG